MVKLRKPRMRVHFVVINSHSRHHFFYYFSNSYVSTYLLLPMATTASTFSSAHRLYVKSLYKRYLTNALDWTIRRDIWRGQAMQIRAEFEKNR